MIFENHLYWTVGEYLIDHRRIYHQTQKSLAKELGISPQYLHDIENNNRVPSEALMLRIVATIMPNSEDFLFSVIGQFSPTTLELMHKLPTYVVAQELDKFITALNERAYGCLRAIEEGAG